MKVDRNDKKLIQRFVHKCSTMRMTLKDMGAAAGRTETWASLISRGKIGGLRFATRNRIREFLGEL